jgi:hypothetical protein
MWLKILNYLLDNGPALIISITALVISVRSWHKSRVFYDIEVYKIGGVAWVPELSNVKEKLNTGKYTILNTYEETYPNNKNTIFMVMGKIKK